MLVNKILFCLIVATIAKRVDLNNGGYYDLRVVKVPYTIWIHNPVTFTKTINIYANANSTFYDVMETASIIDVTYRYSAMSFDWGYYIYELAGKRQDKYKGLYWWLYELDYEPDLRVPPDVNDLALVGVSDLIVKPNRHYLFWYRHISRKYLTKMWNHK